MSTRLRSCLRFCLRLRGVDTVDEPVDSHQNRGKIMCCYIKVKRSLLRKLIKKMHDNASYDDRKLLADETLSIEIELLTPETEKLVLSVKDETLYQRLMETELGDIVEDAALSLWPNVQHVEMYLAPPVTFVNQLETEMVKG
ncbi:MAG: hypothetical protein AAF773_04360 [Cyanobacteria bacterium P01_D01_bin.115]